MMIYEKEYFRKNLKEYRKAKDITARDFAESLGMSYSRYMNYENKEIEPPYSVLCQIADALDVTTDELLGRGKFREMVRFFRTAGYAIKEDEGGKITVVPADDKKGDMVRAYRNKDEFMKDALTAHDEFIKVTAPIAANIINKYVSVVDVIQKAIERKILNAQNGDTWEDSYKTAVDEFCSQIPVSTDSKQDSLIIEKLKAFLRGKGINSDYFGDTFIYVMSRTGYPQKWEKMSPVNWLYVSQAFSLSVMGVDIKQGQKKHLIIKWGAGDERK